MLTLLLAALLVQPPTLDALRDAEDARAPTAAQLDVLRAGLHAPSPALRRVAVRAIGRLERAALVPELAAALGDSAPAVRATAARALILASAHGGAGEARQAVLTALGAERDAAVVGALAEAAGWIRQADTTQARATAAALAQASRIAPHGAARGLYGLARQAVIRRMMPADVVDRLTALVAADRASTTRDAVETRELAAAALVASLAIDEAAAHAVLADADRRVRVIGARAIGALADSAAAHRVARRALADRAASVRVLAVGAYVRRFGAQRDCALLAAAATDADLSVRLAGVDALGSAAGCDAAGRLDALAAALPTPRGGDAGAWHLPAHAVVSLAAVDPARARTRLARFAASPSFFVREYAARAAARVADTALLRRLATDAHPNVRTAAVAGLATTSGHAADDVYLAALASDDAQLLMGAAQALERSPDRRALPALLDALDRVSAARVETSRDARVALLDRARELGDSSSAARVQRYVADFDTAVAAKAADVIGAWTGRRPTPTPTPLPRVPVPTTTALAALGRARVELRMADGAVVVLRLFPDEAPTAAARFARLAREGRLDGLTFHRVVHGRFIQGGSPAANEYAGWGAFTRDELALPNRRGAVGVSTRGRDTGDGQIYVNVGDVFELDHNYTVFAEVERGIDALEAVQEGAVIRRAVVR